MKPMLITDANEIPIGKEWVYETKYDGFRCILEWQEDGVLLLSRNEKCLNKLFPEIVRFCEDIHENIKPYLPIRFDGEIVHLLSDVKSDFSIVQTRGRMRKEEVINNHIQAFPCQYVVFDLLLFQGKETTVNTLEERKKSMLTLFENLALPMEVDYLNNLPLQLVKIYQNEKELCELIKMNNGEGLIAKKKSSQWFSGKRTVQWVKVKNWRTINVFLRKYDKTNGFFTGAVYRDKDVVEIVTFRHGLSEDEAQALSSLFIKNGKEFKNGIWVLEPSICVKINCIGFDNKHLREPRFHSFDFEIGSENCSWSQMLHQLNPIPETIQITHPTKPVWPQLGIDKDDYLLYLQTVAPYMLPFLQNRLLTTIRYPHGANGEKFYQKNIPDYAPHYVKTIRGEDINYIVCNDIQTLLWLGNQLALEFHIPFQTCITDKPTEIVFDLDPPSVDEFTMAVEAALQMQSVFDHFNLQSFVKTSGGKGLQVYIPIPLNTFTYEETRIFTKFVCEFLCNREPEWFTTERLKKNRGNKLYLDYVQFNEGKTIVAPYSPRGNDQASVATPLSWIEVDYSLKPKQFSIATLPYRLQNIGDPFRQFREIGERQPFRDVINKLI